MSRSTKSAERMAPYGPEHPDYPNAPSDWDGGAYLCRDGELYHMRGYGWEHGLGCWNATASWDRIAYRRRDSDGTATAAANGDLPVPQDCQARAESIAQPQSPSERGVA